MNFKVLKKLTILALVSIVFSNSNHVVFAGGFVSKSNTTGFTSQQLHIISTPKYHPGNSPEDGGKAYFGAWNGGKKGKDFKKFIKSYSPVICNDVPASTLKDSAKVATTWRTGGTFGNCFRIDDIESCYPGEYFLRADYENKIIYTIRKSGNEYLCTFYILFVNPNDSTDVRAETVYYLLLSSDSNIKQLLLPIDRELLNQNQGE